MRVTNLRCSQGNASKSEIPILFDSFRHIRGHIYDFLKFVGERWYAITPGRNLRETQEFVKMCIRAANRMNMHISKPRYDEINDDRNGMYSQSIDNAVAKDPQIVLVVIKAPNEEKCSCIKIAEG